MPTAAYPDAVIADGFEECGNSGRVYNREEAVSLLFACNSNREVIIDNFRYREIGDESYLANCEAESSCKAFYYTSV